MKRVLLNSDLLNDTESIYFQIDKFEFWKFPKNNVIDTLVFICDCIKELEMRGIEYRNMFIPMNIYNNAVVDIQKSPFYTLTDSFDGALRQHGIVPMYTVYIPDCLKDQCKL